MIDASGRSDLAIIASPSAVNPVRGQRKSGFGLADAEQPVGDVASDRRAMFDPVAAAAADDPANLTLRMSAAQEIAHVAVTLLATPPFRERMAGAVRETPCKIGADVGNDMVGHEPPAAVGAQP